MNCDVFSSSTFSSAPSHALFLPVMPALWLSLPSSQTEEGPQTAAALVKETRSPFQRTALRKQNQNPRSWDMSGARPSYSIPALSSRAGMNICSAKAMPISSYSLLAYFNAVITAFYFYQGATRCQTLDSHIASLLSPGNRLHSNTGDGVER